MKWNDRTIGAVIACLVITSTCLAQDWRDTPIGRVVGNSDRQQARSNQDMAAARQAQQSKNAAARERDEKERQAQAEYDKQGEPSQSPPDLCMAAATDDVKAIEALVAKGVKANERDPVNGWSPLHYAAFAGSLDAAKLLLDKGASVNLGSGSAKHTPLAIAILRNNHAVAQLFIIRKADVNATDYLGMTPLHIAAIILDNDAVRLLLANGALPQTKSKNGTTPLQGAEFGRDLLRKENVEQKQAAKSVSDPALTKECSRCNGTGRRSAAEMQRLISATASGNIGAGAITAVSPDCPACGGSGRVPLAGTAARGVRGQIGIDADATEWANRDAEIDLRFGNVKLALDAFSGATSSPSPSFSRSSAAPGTLKKIIIDQYRGSSWKVPSKPNQVELLVPAAPSANKPAQLLPATVPSGTGAVPIALKPDERTTDRPNSRASGTGAVPIALKPTEVEWTKLPLAEVKVSGNWTKLERDAKVYNPVNSKNAAQEFGIFPLELAGRSFIQVPMHNTMDEAKLSFSVSTDGIVILAVQGWGGGGSGGEWQKECIDAEGLRRQGWKEIPNPGGRSLFYRSCKAGESMTLRTDKYHPPLLVK